MGAIERGGYRFEPEYSISHHNAAVHVYKEGTFLEEIKFDYSGEFPQQSQIEEIVEVYCEQHDL